MARLIPLLLNPSTPPRVISSSSTQDTSPVVLLPILPNSPTLDDLGPSTTLVPDAIQVKNCLRLPTPPRPKPVTDLIIMPYTQREWRMVMDEVRVLYVKRHYKQCSARCIQVLEGIEDPYRVHPLYSIYLSFYAATCIELIARSLHANSGEKVPLLQSSLQYYTQAESNMEYATFSADLAIMNATKERELGLRSASDSSSIRSSVDSIFSQASSASSSALPSPTLPELSPGVSDKEESVMPMPRCTRSPAPKEAFKPAPLKVKKKVSFSLASEVSTDSLLSPVPELEEPRSPFRFERTPSPASACSISSYLLSQSLNHYLTHLASLSTQLAYHKMTVNGLIQCITAQRKARRSNTPLIFSDFSKINLGTVSKFEESDEARKADLQLRIERLKEQGWKRARFSSERYEKLCEKALSELDRGL